MKVCEYTKEEVLTIIAQHAGESLPEDSVGVLRAIPTKDGGVEVIFLEEKNSTLN
jgi:hypothetical protein